MNNWIIENLGWTLLHSLWQISLISAILWIAFRVLRNVSANLRYSISVIALFLAFIIPVLTFVYLSIEIKTTVKDQPNLSKTLPAEAGYQKTNPSFTNNDFQNESSVSTVEAVSSSSLTFNFFPYLVGIWLVGVGLFSVRFIGGIWKVYQYKTYDVSPVSTDWQERFDKLSKLLQIKRSITFLESQIVKTPVVIGWIKPVVLFPASVFLQLSAEELETILVHELAHIARHDYLVNLIQTSAEITLFYHPCVWWISAKIRAEREFSVDEFVVEIYQTDRLTYANALVNLEELRLVSNQQSTVAMAANGGNLMNRISKILQNHHKPTLSNLSIWSVIFTVTFVVGITAGFTLLKTSEVKKTKTGRKIAVLVSSLKLDENYNQSTQKVLDLQKKYEIPATWVLDSELLNELEKSGKTEDFFQQAQESKSDFILSIPNINHTIFINGDDEYLALWQKRFQSINSIMAKNGNELKNWTTTATQIPQQMEDFIAKTGLKRINAPTRGDFRFHLDYEKDCIISEKKMTCQETSDEKRKETREKYLQYISEILEVENNFSKEKFGIEIPQVLFLPTTNLTNDSATEIFQMLEGKGYEFIKYEEALSNEFYKLQESKYDRDFNLRRWEILDKYLPNKLIDPERRKELEKLQEELKKNKNPVKIEITTKDMKIIEK